MNLRSDSELKGNRKPWMTGDGVIQERSVAWSNLHFNKITPTAVGRLNWKEGPLHMVEQVLKHKGASKVDKWGVKSGCSLLTKAWPRAASPHMGSVLFCTKVPCRLSGLGAQVRQDGQLESYRKGEMMILWTRIEAVAMEKSRWTPIILKR